MADENAGTEVVVEQPEAAPEVVETPEAAIESLSTAEGTEEKEPEPQKTFTQEEVDKIAQKARERAQRGYERRLKNLALERQTQEQGSTSEAPARANYASDEEYWNARSDWKADQLVKQRETEAIQRQQREEADQNARRYAEAADKRNADGKAKYPDWDRTITGAFEDGTIEQGSLLHHAILESDTGHEVAYHLAKNPDEAERIAKLPPLRQIAEFGKLEVKLSAPKTSKAPAPINPIGSQGNVSTDLERADQAAYEMARAKQGARWARNLN